MATMTKFNPAMPQFDPGKMRPFPASIPKVVPDGGNFNPETSFDVKCRTNERMYTGFFFSDEPVNYLIRIFPLQLCSVAVINAVCQLALIPLGLTPVAAQIMAGLIAGTQGFGRIPNYKYTMMPAIGGTHLSDTLGTFGCMLYLFLIGVKVDVGSFKRASKKEWTIGILTFSFPLVLTLPMRYLLTEIYKDDLQDFPFEIISIMTSTTSFHAITCFLFDVNILNTELGRLATSISTISGLCSWVIILLTFAAKQNKTKASLWIGFTFSALGQVTFIIVVLRRVVFWMIKQTPHGKSLKEFYVFSILFMIVGTGFLGEIFGQHCMFGPMILGLAIPNGPPVGSALEHTLDGFVSGVLMPLYFFSIGSSVNLRLVNETYTQVIIMYFGLAFLGKFIGTIVPCISYGIPFRDSVTLGLILGTLGIFDIQTYTTGKITEIITGPEVYPIMILTALGIIVVIPPIVRLLYHPSRRYIVYKKRTIENIKHNVDFRMLVCIYNEENVQTMINIVAVSNPTTESPIAIYLLHIIELTGRASPLLLFHKSHENLLGDQNQDNHIINGFKSFEKQNQGVVNVQPFTSITHFVFAHDDVCMISIERRISFIITPFHKQWNIDGTTKTCKWGNTNKKVLKYAPCSVGILIDRRGYSGSMPVHTSWSSNCNICVLFLGDTDDREAICYGMRMAAHPNVNMTLHRLIPVATKIYNMTEKNLDKNMINHYKLHYANKEHCTYEEDVVKDTVEIIDVIRAVENAYDLILVGRRHDSYSTILSGLKDWSEYPELGFFGEIFATSDFRDKASVLVIQQHSCATENPLPDEPEFDASDKA